MRGCHRLAEVPDSIGGLAGLQELDLASCCLSLQALPSSIGQLAAAAQARAQWLC
jgi:hypothetical protein